MNLKELKEIAKKATPGPWINADTEQCVYFEGCVSLFVSSLASDPRARQEDAKFIAAANPQTILAMLEVVEAAKEHISISYTDVNEFRPKNICEALEKLEKL